MEQKRLERLYRYFFTVARREGVEQIVVGLYLISDSKTLVLWKDGTYNIPRAIVGERTIDQTIKALANEHRIESVKIKMWIDKIKRTIDNKPAHQLNFAIAGKVRKQKHHAWVAHEELKGEIGQTVRKYLKKQKPILPISYRGHELN